MIQNNPASEAVEYKSLDFLGYPNYRVGDDGSVWSRFTSKRASGGSKKSNRPCLVGSDWRKLTTYAKSRYYDVVSLSHLGIQKQYHVHHLVLEAFIGPKPKGDMVACHFDGNERNNRLSNLRWDTVQANIDDEKRIGTFALKPGEKNRCAKLTDDQVHLIRKLYKPYIYGTHRIAKRFGLDKSTVQAIVRGESWKHLLEEKC